MPVSNTSLFDSTVIPHFEEAEIKEVIGDINLRITKELKRWPYKVYHEELGIWYKCDQPRVRLYRVNRRGNPTSLYWADAVKRTPLDCL